MVPHLRQAHLVLKLAAITTTALPSGYLGIAYAAQVAATGDQTPYTWSVSPGALPVGVTLNASTGTLSVCPMEVRGPPRSLSW
jgi:hypothetical protein